MSVDGIVFEIDAGEAMIFLICNVAGVPVGLKDVFVVCFSSEIKETLIFLTWDVVNFVGLGVGFVVNCLLSKIDEAFIPAGPALPGLSDVGVGLVDVKVVSLLEKAVEVVWFSNDSLNIDVGVFTDGRILFFVESVLFCVESVLFSNNLSFAAGKGFHVDCISFGVESIVVFWSMANVLFSNGSFLNDIVGFIFDCSRSIIFSSVVKGCSVFGLLVFLFGANVIRLDPPKILCCFLSVGLGVVFDGCIMMFPADVLDVVVGDCMGSVVSVVV